MCPLIIAKREWYFLVFGRFLRLLLGVSIVKDCYVVLCRCAGGAPLRASLVYRRGATRMLDHANPPAGGAMAVYRKRISWLVVAIAALFSLPASATLMPMSDASFSWTADSSTGFDWLDFDGGPALSAVGRSWDDVSAQLGSGGDYEGWDFATRAQVNGFVLNTGSQILISQR